MTDAETNLGKIILGLAKQVTYVRFHSVESVMSKGLYVIRAYTIKNGVTTSHEEMITELSMAQISDPKVIVDAIIGKMKAQKK